MDELYRLLVMFDVGKPVTRKRLLRVNGITAALIQKALDESCIIETKVGDDKEIGYLITDIGIKRR